MQAATDAGAVSEGLALEVAAGLAALDSLLTGLGAFLSPYVASLLHLLLSPRLLACPVGGCSAVASRLAGRLPGVLPPRLLLQPLAEQLEPAVQVRWPCMQCPHLPSACPLHAWQEPLTQQLELAVSAFLGATDHAWCVPLW